MEGEEEEEKGRDFTSPPLRVLSLASALLKWQVSCSPVSIGSLLMGWASGAGDVDDVIESVEKLSTTLMLALMSSHSVEAPLTPSSEPMTES